MTPQPRATGAEVKFDAFDFEVVKAHGVAAGSAEDGGAMSERIRYHHAGPLPAQRLSGLVRRGLMRRDPEGRYFLTSAGADAAHAFRDRLAREGEGGDGAS